MRGRGGREKEELREKWERKEGRKVKRGEETSNRKKRVIKFSRYNKTFYEVFCLYTPFTSLPFFSLPFTKTNVVKVKFIPGVKGGRR